MQSKGPAKGHRKGAIKGTNKSLITGVEGSFGFGMTILSRCTCVLTYACWVSKILNADVS